MKKKRKKKSSPNLKKKRKEMITNMHIYHITTVIKIFKTKGSVWIAVYKSIKRLDIKTCKEVDTQIITLTTSKNKLKF